jgi:hypothetical protein
MTTDQKFFNVFTGFQSKPLPWQKQLRVGDYYEIAPLDGSNFPTIYGQILEVKGEGFFKVKAYNALCLQGSEGQLCVVEPTRKISPAEFEKARANGWQVSE